MDQKLKISLIANVILLGVIILLFYAKGNVTDQAHVAVGERNKIINQMQDKVFNEAALWTIVDSIYKMPAKERTRAKIQAYAEAQALPRCGGAKCKDGDDAAKITTSLSNTPGKSNITIRGGGYMVVVYFTDKKGDKPGTFTYMDTDNLRGVATQPPVEEEEAAAAE
jgi:hypothetical protein